MMIMVFMGYFIYVTLQNWEYLTIEIHFNSKVTIIMPKQ
jgi:hypothetical protein